MTQAGRTLYRHAAQVVGNGYGDAPSGYIRNTAEFKYCQNVWEAGNNLDWDIDRFNPPSKLKQKSMGYLGGSNRLRDAFENACASLQRCLNANRRLAHSDEELEHFGILGMKWGVRRYQNEDGSLTDAGRKRYGVLTERYNQAAKSAHQTYSRATDMVNKANARVSKADEKLHKFNAKLGYEAPHTDKNPLKGQQPNQQQNNVPKPQGEQKQAPQQNQQQQQPSKPSNNEISPNYWTKPVKRMNDAELKAYADRLASQKKIEDALKPSTPANSEQVKKKAKDHKVRAYVAGEIKNLGKDAVADVRREASKRLARHFMSTYLGWESGNNNNNNNNK
jgi:hypothetical protein